MKEIKKCPFCGGKAKLSYRYVRSYLPYREGYDPFSDENIYLYPYDRSEQTWIYRVQVICNKCHSRGPLVITQWVHRVAPRYHKDPMETEYGPYIDKAIDGWNDRYQP